MDISYCGWQENPQYAIIRKCRYTDAVIIKVINFPNSANCIHCRSTLFDGEIPRKKSAGYFSLNSWNLLRTRFSVIIPEEISMQFVRQTVDEDL